MSRREQIRMSPDEVRSFLDGERVVICASNGRDGWPHLMPLWYVMRGEEMWAWTYAKSQKTRNIERDPRVTLEVEAGDQYQELRGVMIKADCVVHRELGDVSRLGGEIFRRYAGSSAVGEDFGEAVARQAAKRVALQFVPRSVASWDHSKLGGVY